MNLEPEIIINGKLLTPAQSMTIRVAVNNFLGDLVNPDALGVDQHGRK